MKEIVVICYQFHKSLFLLRFCNDLAGYEHASLRFINNYNSTTSLYDRRNNKLLVTFRNENMVRFFLFLIGTHVLTQNVFIYFPLNFHTALPAAL